MITIHQTDLLNGIKAIKSTCGKMTLNPILGTFHIKTIGQSLQLTATDTDSSARTIIEANVTEQVEFCVNADKLENIVNALDNLITIDIQETNAIIKSGNTEFNLLTLLPIDFPPITFELPEDNKITLDKTSFTEGVNKTAFATLQETSALIGGVCITFNKEEGYEMAATDGNRLSQVIFTDKPVNTEGQYVIPKKVLLDVAKTCGNEIEIYFNPTKVIFKTDNYLFMTSLLNGNYPKYQQLIPQNNPNKAIIKRTDLLHSLEKVAIMSDDRQSLTTFNFTNNSLDLFTKSDNGNAKDKFDVDYTNSDLKISFNYKFLLEGIRAMDTENITFEMNLPTSACLIKGNFNYLVMPVVMKG